MSRLGLLFLRSNILYITSIHVLTDIVIYSIYKGAGCLIIIDEMIVIADCTAVRTIELIYLPIATVYCNMPKQRSHF